MDLVKQEYWDNSYKDFNFYIPDDTITKFLDEHAPVNRSKVFEVGCFPGRYLAHLGKKGWIVNGMDLTPETETTLVKWMQSQQINTGFIKHGDVLNYLSTTSDTYPFVCSFGFIEHFENFAEILELHTRIIATNGTLIVTTPNFRGLFQRYMHKYLDNENLKRHYLPSMQPNKWKAILEKKGFTVKFSGYIGRFDFWYDRQKRNIFEKVSVEIMRRVAVPLFSWLPNSEYYSPYCVIVATKE